MANYILTLRLQITTDLEPIVDYYNKIVGFILADDGTAKPYVCFEIENKDGSIYTDSI